MNPPRLTYAERMAIWADLDELIAVLELRTALDAWGA